MKKIFLAPVLILLAQYSDGQNNNGTIKIRKNDTIQFVVHVIADTTSIPFANVSFFDGNKLLSKGNTDMNGKFFCKALKRDFEGSQLIVKCAYVGCRNSERRVIVADNTTYELSMIDLTTGLPIVNLTLTSQNPQITTESSFVFLNR